MRVERVVTYLTLASVCIGLGEQIQRHLAGHKKKDVPFGFQSSPPPGHNPKRISKRVN